MKRILIVEDDPFTAEAYRNGLEWAGFAVAIAPTGEDAITHVMRHPPDAVLLDLVLGESSGIDILRFIRSHATTHHAPVIMLSNSFMPELVRDAWEAGATECFDKAHASPVRLAARLRSALNQQGARGPFHAARTPEPASPTSPYTVEPVARENALHNGLLEVLQGRIASTIEARRAWIACNHLVTSAEFSALVRAVHAVAGVAGMAGRSSLAQLASVLQALLSEVQIAPAKLNWSCIRTIDQAIELMPGLSCSTNDQSDEENRAPLVLAVDDEPVAREFLAAALESANLNTLNVGDPALALRMCEQNRFDLAFFDVDMPGMNGFELCERLHETMTNPSTPVVFVTSLQDEQTRLQFSHSGALDFINKPVMLSEVSVKALVHLHRGHLERPA